MDTILPRILNYVLVMVLVAASFYAFALIDKTDPWHSLQQIAITPSSDMSLDENNNGRIDPGIIEDTLQDITNNGAQTTNALTMGGLTVTGTSSFTGQATFNSNIILNSITNCQTDLITDANGKIICSTQEDKDPNNELQTLSHPGNQICISDTSSCVNDNVNDADSSPSNEIQTLSLSGSQLCLSKGGGCVTLPSSSGSSGSSSGSGGTISSVDLSLSGSTLQLKIIESSNTFSDSVDLSGLIGAGGTGGGSSTIPTLAQVLVAGNDAQGNSIVGLSSLSIGSANFNIMSVPNYGSLLTISGVNALGINNAYLGTYNNKGTVAIQQICLNGDCKTSWSQVTGSSGSSIVCTDVSSSAPVSCSVSCPYGYIVTGGGCAVGDVDMTILDNKATSNGWYCYGAGSEWSTDQVKCYARCCKIA